MENDMKYRLLLDNSLEMALIFNESGRVTFANEVAKASLGYVDFSKVHIGDIFPNEFEKNSNGFATSLSLDGELHDIMAYRHNRTCFRTEAKLVKIASERNMYICLAEDISKREFLEKEIVRVTKETDEAMKVKSEFVANVTHELRTPVNGILGNVRELLAVEQDREKLKGLTLIERCCNDMNNIINNILDFSKLEAGKFTLEPRKFNFRNMMDYVKNNHLPKITEKGLEFFMSVSPDIPEDIISDELRISQVLNNLLSNACKFTAVGKITVEVVKTAQTGNREELFFLVMDTGVGIDKASQDKLFKSFSQVDASISRKYGGTGLGLNICKQLVEMMGGSINVTSEKGKGSMFSFSIWVEVPEDEINTADAASNTDVQQLLNKARSMYEERNEDDNRTYGSVKNTEELKKNLSKLILCIEMGNWEKAEIFMNVIRELTSEAPQNIKSAILRLKMAVQKENYEKSIAGCESLKELV